ncbi:hypothetical protein LTR62_002208 [Meristemomyces frigidus]|uniref:Rhodopsin domain-containing protein n=1 Tax=Meristemomyces frigidus TaxID=1508187 RepID=A0AAN7YLA8_9PEZI|nr:hypothetical protein LTR62_002208 [Meristemomyces frigidus]
MLLGGDASPVSVLVVTLVFTILATACGILRLITRLFVSRNAGYDDAFITAATIFSIGSASLTISEASFDDQRRNHGIDAAQQLRYAKSVYASIIIYNAALFCIKMSLLFQYIRIFPQHGFRIACFTLMAVVIVYSNWCVWSAIFFCKPIAAFWDFDIAGAKCFDKQAVWFANAAINIVTDIATVILPLPLVRQLNMQKRSKLALSGVFALGFFTCLVSVLRLESIYAAAHLQGGLNFHGAMAAVWSAVEINTGILCSCLPTLRTLLARLVPNLLGASSQRTSHGLSTSRRPQGSVKVGPLVSHCDYGRGLSGRDEPARSAFARRNSSIDLDVIPGSSRKEIRVVTVVEQDIDKQGSKDRDGSEEGSTRDLIHRSSSSA